MSISRRLYIGFAVIIFLAVVVGIVGVIGMSRLRISGLLMYERQVVGIEKAGKALSAFENVRLDCRMLVIYSLYDDMKSALDAQKSFWYYVREFRELMEVCGELSDVDELGLFNARIMDLFENDYLPSAERIIEISIGDIPDHNNRLHINVLLAYVSDVSDRIMRLMTGMIDLNVAISRQTSADNETLTRQMIMMQIFLFVLAVAITVLIAVFIISGIMKPINESADVLHKIAAGDFDARILGKYGGEFGIIKESVNSTAVELGKHFDEIEQAGRAAQAASKAKSEFLSNMSHEMRTPLNAITGMATVGIRAGNISGKTDALRKIDEASSHLLGVVNDILDMAKIEADKLELKNDDFHFGDMIKRLCIVVRQQADEKNQELSVKIDEGIPAYLTGDGQRLAQIVTNLMANAIKFNREGGRIGLEIKLVQSTEEFNELLFIVTDDGIGISAAQQEKLFNPFEQVDSGISRMHGGTGLGLSISKRIVEMMGGRIWVESELGKGSTFLFTVRAGRCYKTDDGFAPHSVKVPEVLSDDVLAGKRLLIVEDIKINRHILISLLNDTGLVIDCAENGREAVDMINAAPDKFDVILMDIQMPVMDGLEATRLIRGIRGESKKRLPIIAMTANVFTGDIEDCIKAGMDDHLGKPLEFEKMMLMLRRYLV